jgi:predicted transcriptional regulator
MSAPNEKALNHLKKAAFNLTKAAEQLGQQLKEQDSLHKSIINAAPLEDQAKLIGIIQQVKNLQIEANEAKNSDVSDIITKLNNLK